MSALFTSVPIDPALNIIKDLLDKDNTLKERTVMEVGDIILLLEFCLKNTYFSFQGQFYEQVEGAAMGSPVSPIVANLYMEYLEQKALSTVPHPQVSGADMWMTPLLSTRKPINKVSCNTLTSVDPAIRFTVEDNKEDGSIPFLDTIVKPGVDGSLSITVYRKPTHTGPVFTVGQSPSPLSQIQCHPNPLPQGFHHVQQSWVGPKRKGAPQEGSHQLQIS